MKELLLRTILTRKELNVINQQAVSLAEAATELHELTMLNGRDKLIRKLF